jgi:lysophospholipase L1-like esterase
MVARVSLFRHPVLAAAVVAFAAEACSLGRVGPATGAVVVAENRFESEILAFEDSDRVNPPAPGGIVFVGSSSIRMWPDLRSYFPGQNVIQRGFGGSRLDEVVQYAPRIVLRYKPKLVILYAGENDIAEGKTPAQVFADYTSFVGLVQGDLPTTRIAYISIKPSPSRWELVDKMRAANSMIQQYIAAHTGQTYVDVVPPMIGPNGRPRPELFVSDSLHMTRAGYAIWQQLLTPIIAEAAH